jgi:transposase-like protein
MKRASSGRQRRLDGVGQIILSLSARGFTTGEIAALFAEVYGATVCSTTSPNHRRGARRS